MKTLLEKAGASAIRAFIPAAIAVLYGIGTVPDRAVALALGIAAVYAGGAAALRALQVFVPQLTFAEFVPNALAARLLDSFTRAFLGTFFATWIGYFEAPEQALTTALITASIVGAGAAALRVAQATFTEGESPKPAQGLPLAKAA